MGMEWDGHRRFPEVHWVDAAQRDKAIDLIFGTTVEGQGATLRVTLVPPQWENLKFLVEGSKSN